MKSRNTRQKEILQKEFESFTNFFTAEDLHDKIKKRDKEIGIATVYRFLKDLREKRKLHSYVCDRKMIYSKEKNSHSHYACQCCGKTFHINIKNLDFIKKEIPGNICHFQIEVAGVCDDCSDKFQSK